MQTDLELVQYLESFLTPRRLSLYSKVLAQRTKHITVVTEDVYQLHNTSAVIRSCDVFGIQDVHVVEEINAKRIDREIAMGAQKWVDVHRHNKITSCITDLKTQGYQIIATTPHNDAVMLENFDISKPTALFFGRETEGLSDAVLKEADGSLKIPMVGFTESLNISVSAAIILQHLTTKLRASQVNWQLSEEEKASIRFEWTKKAIKSHKEIIERYYKENKGV
ncbi:TrmH family RNA methyltransferase [Aquimarina rhabdastrellae]